MGYALVESGCSERVLDRNLEQSVAVADSYCNPCCCFSHSYYVRMTANTRKKGSSAEDRAVEYLLAEGYSIICRNYQIRSGEIDVVAGDPDGVLVFVEVKASFGPGYGNPLFRVSRAKQRTLIRIARHYLQEHKMNNRRCRFDVIAFQKNSIDHLKNAFLA
ncbi:MAG: YraN family protein [Chitinivibrionales bacterium]|nr:YraN family protein [Chitinivibrionales bacterium]